MRVNPMKHAMKYGLILGVLFALNFLLSVTGVVALQLLSYVLVVAIVYFTYRFTVHYRENERSGSLSFWQGFSYVMWLFLFAALVSSVFKLLYLKFIAPDYLAAMLNDTLLVLESMQYPMGDGELAQIERMMQPARFALASLWVNVLSAIFLGPIVASFAKHEKSIFDDDSIKPIED